MWYPHCMPLEFTDSFEYSDDGRYRWWYERRWSDAPGLCWVGLNPSTGDTTVRPRPRCARSSPDQLGLGAVTVVNLFSWRATKSARPAGGSLRGVRHRRFVHRRRHPSGCCSISLTLLAWGSHGSLLDRGRERSQARAQCDVPWSNSLRRAAPSALRRGRPGNGAVRRDRFARRSVAVADAGQLASGS